MLVDVVKLRHRGEKRAREDVREATPVRGWLQLGLERSAAHYRSKFSAPLMAGLLMPSESKWALPPLLNARVMKIKPGGGMLIVGYEEVSNDGGRHVDQVRQAWWVRVVTGAEAQTRSP